MSVGAPAVARVLVVVALRILFVFVFVLRTPGRAFRTSAVDCSPASNSLRP
jgi:hypothetical protein